MATGHAEKGSRCTWTLGRPQSRQRTPWLCQQRPGPGQEPRESPVPPRRSLLAGGGGRPGGPRLCLGLRCRDGCSPFSCPWGMGFQGTFLCYGLSSSFSWTQQRRAQGGQGRRHLRFFRSIGHFLSLFNIFQISGDCFPPLDGVWAPANRNTRRPPRPRVGRRSRALKFLLNLASLWQISLH